MYLINWYKAVGEEIGIAGFGHERDHIIARYPMTQKVRLKSIAS